MLRRDISSTARGRKARALAWFCFCMVVLAGCSSKPSDAPDAAGADAASTADAYDGPSARGTKRYSFALLQTTEEEFTVADFVEEQDETMCPTTCDGNSAPTLGEPIFVVNGVVTDTLSASVDDDLAVFVPFEDVDCNLGCGARSESHVEPQGGGDGIASLPSNMPCSTTESKVYLRISPSSVPLDQGHYTYSNWIEDGCGARSDTASLEFDVE